MKIHQIYVVLAVFALLILLKLVGFFDAHETTSRREIKQENKAAAQTIKAEQEKRRQWQQDSIKLRARADSLAAFNRQQKIKEETYKKREDEVRHIPVYTTDAEYDQFFSKRYRQKNLVR